MKITQTPGNYIIPRHAVFKRTNGKIKLRVVFDASATSATTSSGTSLNNLLFIGPKLQCDIADLLVQRLRQTYSKCIGKYRCQPQIVPISNLVVQQSVWIHTGVCLVNSDIRSVFVTFSSHPCIESIKIRWRLKISHCTRVIIQSDLC